MSEYTPSQKREVTLSGDHAELLKGVLAKHMADMKDAYQTLEGSAIPVHHMQQAQFAETASVIVQAEEASPEVRRFGVLTGMGRIVEVDIDKFPADHDIHALAKPIELNSSGEFTFIQEEVATQGDVSLAGRLPVNYAAKPEAPKRFKRPKGRTLAGAALALALAGGGVAVAANPGILNTESTQTALDPNATPVVPEANPVVQLTARDIAVGDCLVPETGKGKALVQGKLTASADVKWKIQRIDGTEDVVADEGVFPKLSIPEDTVNLAACITPEKRDAAVKVGADNVVEINFDAIEQQIGIVQGAKEPSSERWEGISPVPGVTSEEVIADLVASMNNPAENADVAIAIARADAATAFISDPEKAKEARVIMKAKLEADIQARVAGLHAAQKSPVDKVTVKFLEKENNFIYKGPAAPETTKFTLDNLESTITLNPAP